MSASFAYAQIGGNLGRDPEVLSTPGGKKVVKFSIAVEQGYGESKTTGWHNIVAFGTQADFAEKYLKKGSSVLVNGKPQIRSWDDKQTGAKRTATEVVASSIDFGQSSGSGSGEKPERQAATPPTRQQVAPPARTTAAAPASGDSPFDDDIPF